MDLSLIGYPLVMILYLPPLFLWAFEKDLKKPRITNYLSKSQDSLAFCLSALVGLSVSLWFLTGDFYFNLYSYKIYFMFAYFSVIFYSSFILVYMVLGGRQKINPVIMLSLAVYGAFAISELWEIPFHVLTWSQSVEMAFRGMMFSFPKALGIVFYFWTLYKAGWRPDIIWLISMGPIICYGVVMSDAWALGFRDNLLAFHFYRVIWAGYLIWAFLKTPKAKLT